MQQNNDQSPQIPADFEQGAELMDEEDRYTSVEVEPMQEAPKAPGRMRRFIRRVLMWAIVILGVFALGVGATWVTQVRQLQSERQTLLGQIQELQAEESEAMEALRAQHRSDIEALQEDIDAANLHIQLVNALVDVSSARVALGEEDLVGVRSALAGTDDRLSKLQTELGADGVTAVKAIRDQLASLLVNLGDDPALTDQDLERLIANLLALERSVFSE